MKYIKTWCDAVGMDDNSLPLEINPVIISLREWIKSIYPKDAPAVEITLPDATAVRETLTRFDEPGKLTLAELQTLFAVKCITKLYRRTQDIAAILDQG